MNSNKVFLYLISLLSITLIIKKLKLYSLLAIIASILIGYSITKKWDISIAFGLILGNIVVSLTDRSPIKNVERFSSSKAKKSRRKKTKKQKNKAVKTEGFDDTQDEIISENFSQGSEEEYFIDTKGSFLDNYKSLTKNQISGLNKDTKSLIDTQKQLIETLKNMGPALKDGKQVLDTFKNFFGKEQDMTKILSNFKV
mgnify:CR=1 FL=1|tara:strand:- start:599 stop:1192 length:594 start_codon:yes stop_codon:yes gene_type:complete